MFADTGLRVVYPVTPESDHGYVAKDTVSRQRYSVGSPGQRWRFTFDLENVGKGTLKADGIIQAHIDEYGITEEFTTEVPQPLSKGPINRFETDAVAVAGAKTIAVIYTAGRQPTVGTYFRFGSAKKVYKVMGWNGHIMRFFPILYTDVADGTQINHEPHMYARYDNNQPRGVTINQGTGLPTVSIIEAL